MAKFNLTAELQIRGPIGLNKVVADIHRKIRGVNGNINIGINASVNKNLVNLNNNLSTLRSRLADVHPEANRVATAFHNLNAALTAMSKNVNVAKNIATTAKQLKKVQTNAHLAANEMEIFGQQAALAARRFLAFAAPVSSMFALIGAIKQGIRSFIEFQHVSVRIGQVTDRSVGELRGLNNEIRRLATTLGVSSHGLQDVAQILAQAGLSARDTKKSLDALAKTELAPTFDNIRNTTEGAIALFGQFGTKVEDLESQLGSINAVSARYAVESADITSAIRKSGGAFSSAGGNLREFLALFTSVRSKTRESADSIATAFRTIFARLQRPKTIQKIKDLIGVDLDEGGQFVGPFKAIQRLHEALTNLPDGSLLKARVAEEIGGIRQIGKTIPLINEFATAMEALGVAEQGQTSLAKDMVTAQDSLLRQFIKLKERFLELFDTIGNSGTFKVFVGGLLSVANALITVTNALVPLLPLLTSLAAIKFISNVIPFAKGFATKFTTAHNLHFGGGPLSGRGFAVGGLVPGSGTGDKVPARLTPGEVVINKRSVQEIGLANVLRMNRLGKDAFNNQKPLLFEEGGLVPGDGDNLRRTSGGVLVPQVKTLISIVDALKDSLGSLALSIDDVSTTISRPQPHNLERKELILPTGVEPATIPVASSSTKFTGTPFPINPPTPTKETYGVADSEFEALQRRRARTQEVLRLARRKPSINPLTVSGNDSFSKQYQRRRKNLSILSSIPLTVTPEVQVPEDQKTFNLLPERFGTQLPSIPLAGNTPATTPDVFGLGIDQVARRARTKEVLRLARIKPGINPLTAKIGFGTKDRLVQQSLAQPKPIALTDNGPTSSSVRRIQQLQPTSFDDRAFAFISGDTSVFDGGIPIVPQFPTAPSRRRSRASREGRIRAAGKGVLLDRLAIQGESARSRKRLDQLMEARYTQAQARERYPELFEEIQGPPTPGFFARTKASIGRGLDRYTPNLLNREGRVRSGIRSGLGNFRPGRFGLFAAGITATQLLLSSQDDTPLDDLSPEAKDQAKSRAGLQGIFTGALTGGSLGAAGGPAGIAIGAVIGGLTGFASAVNVKAKEIRDSEISSALESTADATKQFNEVLASNDPTKIVSKFDELVRIQDQARNRVNAANEPQGLERFTESISTFGSVALEGFGILLSKTGEIISNAVIPAFQSVSSVVDNMLGTETSGLGGFLGNLFGADVVNQRIQEARDARQRESDKRIAAQDATSAEAFITAQSRLGAISDPTDLLDSASGRNAIRNLNRRRVTERGGTISSADAAFEQLLLQGEDRQREYIEALVKTTVSTGLAAKAVDDLGLKMFQTALGIEKAAASLSEFEIASKAFDNANSLLLGSLGNSPSSLSGTNFGGRTSQFGLDSFTDTAKTLGNIMPSLSGTADTLSSANTAFSTLRDTFLENPALLRSADFSQDENGFVRGLDPLLQDITGRLRDAGVGDEVINAIETKIEGISPDALSGFQTKPDEFMKLLFEDFEGLRSKFSDVAGKIDDQSNKLLDSLGKFVNLQTEIGESQDAVLKLQDQAARFSAERLARELGGDATDFFGVAGRQAAFVGSQERLTGLGGGDALTPQLIFERALASRAATQNAQSQLENAAPGFDTANTALELRTFEQETQNSIQALKNLADASNLNAAIQERLASIEREDESRQGLFERFAGSDLQGRQQLVQQADAALKAIQAGTLDVLTIQEQQAAIAGLQTFGDTEIGDTGRTGRDFLRFLRETSFVQNDRNRGALFGQRGGNRTEAELLRDQIAQNFQTAIEAQNLLTQFLQDTQDQFFTNLEANQKAFLQSLGGIISPGQKVNFNPAVANNVRRPALPQVNVGGGIGNVPFVGRQQREQEVVVPLNKQELLARQREERQRQATLTPIILQQQRELQQIDRKIATNKFQSLPVDVREHNLKFRAQKERELQASIMRLNGVPEENINKFLGRNQGKGEERKDGERQLAGVMQNFNNNFADPNQPLIKALNAIPHEIAMTGNFRIEHIFNGAEVLTRIMPEIRQSMENLIKTKLLEVFPELRANIR